MIDPFLTTLMCMNSHRCDRTVSYYSESFNCDVEGGIFFKISYSKRSVRATCKCGY